MIETHDIEQRLLALVHEGSDLWDLKEVGENLGHQYFMILTCAASLASRGLVDMVTVGDRHFISSKCRVAQQTAGV